MLLAKQTAVTWSLEEPKMDRGPATRVALARIKSNRARKLILRRCFKTPFSAGCDPLAAE